MKSLESNKIFAAILVAGIIAMFSGFTADILTSTHDLEKNAVEIEGSDGSTAPVAKKANLPEPVLALIASADIARGKKVSKACAACHSFTKGGRAGVGPNIWNIVGANKQSKEGFSYSGKLNQQGGDVWSYAELNKFLYKPKKYAAGTKMNFIGLKKATDRASIIAWLRTLADAPASLPNAAAIDAENAELLPAPVEEIVEVGAEAVEAIEEAVPVSH
ncbi:MAG: c-type cytochrome [Alphaproteobacteria bacterium]|nr:c-type cytochrome [Alphaproteobacteria bacterium]